MRILRLLFLFVPIFLLSQTPVKHILIVYHSETGNTKKMAESVADGAKSVKNTEVLLRTTTQVTASELEAADALILGTPTYYANMSAPMKQFIDDWFMKYKIPLSNKIGAAFSTGGGMTAGKEFAIISLLLAMMNNGMIIVGPLHDGYGTFGVSAVTGQPDPGISDYELGEARKLGERVATVAAKFR